MITTVVMCDFCERPVLSRVEVIDGSRCRNVPIHKTKELDTTRLFPHLCKDCAEKLDLVLGEARLVYTSARSVMLDYAKKNAERREQLGTRG